MSKKQINNMIIDLSGLLGIIFQFISVPDIIKIIVALIFGLAILYYFYSVYEENKKYTRETRIREVTRFISNAKNHIVFFAGNLSWTTDYRNIIQQKINEGCSVDVFYDKNNNYGEDAKRQIENRISELKAIKCNVYELDDCYSLRCIISDANNISEEFRGIIIEKIHNDTEPTKNKYKIINFDFRNNHTLALLFYNLIKIISKSFTGKDEGNA